MRTRCKRVRVIRAETRARAEKSYSCVANAYVMRTRCKRVRVIRCKGYIRKFALVIGAIPPCGAESTTFLFDVLAIKQKGNAQKIIYPI